MGKILGICISEKRGTEKHEIQEANLVKEWGIEGDAHGGKWHRQVSLLSFEKIEDFRAKGAEVDFGAFGENLIVEMIKEAGYDVKETLLLPDGRTALEKQLIRLADQRQINVIFTTGGTGFAERDVTPEATIAVCDRMANGIADAIRNYSMTITPRAMFSRAVSGIRKRTLIINLPGSPKAVQEALEFLLPHLDHGIGILRGSEGECAR